jgi:hypothetical protein
LFAHQRTLANTREQTLRKWMQTWLVHMRSPLRLARELGLPGFAVFQLLVGGTVLAALVHVLFVARLVWMMAMPLDDAMDQALFGFDAATLLSGYVISAALGLIGLARRQLLGCAWVLLLMPVYWLLLSLAAWRALFQLLRDPYRWEKTEHGLARTSRLGTGVRR